MNADRIVFSKEWFKELQQGDDFVETTPQEIAYILYAAAIYSFTGEKTNLAETFGPEYKELNRTMSGYYGQIRRIIDSGDNQKNKNQKYNDDAITELVLKGYTQVQICQELGYDISKSKSLSSNPGYKKGRELLKASKTQKSTAVDSSSENCQEIAKKDEGTKVSFDF